MMTDDPEQDRRRLRRRHAFAEKHRRQDRGPDRHGEFDRHDLADRDQRQREKPAELRTVMNEVAGGMLWKPRGLHHRKSAFSPDQRIEQQQSERRARFHQLKYIQFAHRLAPRNGQDQHQREPAGHPQGGQWFGLCAVHAWDARRRGDD
jgi:hypothetical protein